MSPQVCELSSATATYNQSVNLATHEYPSNNGGTFSIQCDDSLPTISLDSGSRGRERQFPQQQYEARLFNLLTDSIMDGDFHSMAKLLEVMSNHIDSARNVLEQVRSCLAYEKPAVQICFETSTNQDHCNSIVVSFSYLDAFGVQIVRAASDGNHQAELHNMQFDMALDPACTFFQIFNPDWQQVSGY